MAVFLKSAAVIVASGLLLTILGTLSVLLFQPDRIPVIIESKEPLLFPSMLELSEAVFPPNLFSVFDGDSTFLLPVLFLSMLLGFGFSFDKVLSRPAVQLFDSLSRIFFYLSGIFMRVLAFGIFFLSASLMRHIIGNPELKLFKQLFMLLGADTLIILLLIYPLLLFFITKERHPYKLLYALTAPAIAGFISGNSQFSYISLSQHVKKNLGVARPGGAVSLPIFVLIGKAGTALVSSVSFIILLSSYSSLGIGIQEIIWICFASFGISFLSAAAPGTGAISAVAALCAAYGRGLEEAYLILLPALPLLMSFSVLIDTVSAGLGVEIVCRQESGYKDVHMKDFI